MNKIIKVLVVDDSALARRILSDLLNTNERIEVVGTAQDGQFVISKIQELKPDVITLDVEMRNVGGLEILPEIVSKYHLPVIMVSAHTEQGAESTLQALECGAVDFVTKPQAKGFASVQDIGDLLAQKIIGVAGTKVKQVQHRPKPQMHEQNITQSVPPRISSIVKKQQEVDLIAIGASTGGTEAIKDVLVGLPNNLPGIVITQHMPAGFTKTFSERLNSLCRIQVKEAEDGERITEGTAFIARGDRHLAVQKRNGEYYTKLLDTERVNRHKPSVDVLYQSVIGEVGSQCLGIILTGMGADGADGLKDLRKIGATTVAQDEQSCVVFGMPKEAIKRGGATHVLPLHDISDFIVSYVKPASALANLRNTFSVS